MTILLLIIPSILCLLIFIPSLANAIAPRWVWKKLEGWKATEEPSDQYFMMRRISGILGVIFVLFIALIPTLIFSELLFT